MSSDQLRDRIAAALSTAGAFCGECGFEPGETGCSDCVSVRKMYVTAVMAEFAPELAARDEKIEQLSDEITMAYAQLRTALTARDHGHGEDDDVRTDH